MHGPVSSSLDMPGTRPGDGHASVALIGRSLAPLDLLLPALLVALLLVLLQARSGAGSYTAVIAAMAAFSYVVMASGRLLLFFLAAPAANPSAAYTLGLLTMCLALYALATVLPLTAAAAFGAVSAMVVGLQLALSRRRWAPPPDRRAVVGFALCIAFTAAWCIGPAGAYDVLRSEHVLPAWGDHFIHGARISQFGDLRALGRGSIFLADFQPSFYHFAQYLAAAALAGMLDQPGLALAVSAWMPLGFLAMTAGAYALGERLAGAAGGIAALAVIAVLPDTSNYGLRNGLLSFHWSVIAHPGAMYALGGAFVSLVLLEQWRRERRLPALLASGALAASILFFRGHVFVLYAPVWAATAIYLGASQGGRKRRVGFWLALALGAASATASLASSIHWRFGGPALPRFLELLHNWNEPTAYTGVYADLVSWYPWWYSLPIGILLAVLAALGAFVLLLPAAAILAHRCGELRAIDAFPAFLAYGWLLLMLFAPVTWAEGGPELIDRPVVLLYACAAIWTVCLALRCLAARARGWVHRLWPAMLAGSLAILPSALVNAEAMARPKFTGGPPHLALRIEPGLIQASAFLREHALPGDTFAVSGSKEDFAVVDLAVRVCALSGVPTYLARPHLEMIKDGARKAVVATRLSALRQVDRETDHDRAMAMLRALRIQWYVVADGQGPRWDPAGARAAFRDGAVSLYSTKSSST
ncbi:MAG TPA: hypothetical protein VML57_13225 [Burkholderiales bacterium]|nr:hypothetical protein [Burkholderiales bacterium]